MTMQPYARILPSNYSFWPDIFCWLAIILCPHIHIHVATNNVKLVCYEWVHFNVDLLMSTSHGNLTINIQSNYHSTAFVFKEYTVPLTGKLTVPYGIGFVSCRMGNSSYGMNHVALGQEACLLWGKTGCYCLIFFSSRKLSITLMFMK